MGGSVREPSGLCVDTPERQKPPCTAWEPRNQGRLALPPLTRAVVLRPCAAPKEPRFGMMPACDVTVTLGMVTLPICPVRGNGEPCLPPV